MTYYLFEKEKYIKDSTLTVGELIKILNDYPKEMKVMTAREVLKIINFINGDLFIINDANLNNVAQALNIKTGTFKKHKREINVYSNNRWSYGLCN